MFTKLDSRSLISKISMWIGIIVGGSSLLILVLGITAVRQIQEINQSIEVQLQEQLQVQEIDLNAQVIISSYRAYIAYGREEFLKEMYKDRSKLTEHLEKLQATYSSRETVDRLKEYELTQLTKIWRSLSSHMDKGIQYKRSNELEAISLLSTSEVTPGVESFNAHFTNLEKLQEAHVQSLVKQNERVNYWLLLIPVGLVLLVCIMSYYLVSFLRRTVINPVLYMSQTVSQIAAGQYVEVRTSYRKDELGDLQRGILHMSEELRNRAKDLEVFNRELINQRDLLEAQNEEIIAQQEEQQDTLVKLTGRERELELIASYQEKLAGYLDLQQFLQKSVPALLQALGTDAAAVVLKRNYTEEAAHLGQLVYYSGYPSSDYLLGMVELYGPSQRIFEEKEVIKRKRELTGSEKGIFSFYEIAYDYYYPLFDQDRRVYGYLLLTNYGKLHTSDQEVRLSRGLIKQFSLALMAQLLNEDRIQQAQQLEQLNNELQVEKQRIQEQRDLINQINETIHEGLLMVDPEGMLLFSNQRMGSYFQYHYVEGHTLSSFCEFLNEQSGGRTALLSERIRDTLAGRMDSLQERFQINSSEGARYFELYMTPLEGESSLEQKRGCLLVFRERTEEEKVDEMKNEFISIVSHELRTPLSSVLGFIEILLHRKVTPEKQQKYLETIHKEANRLSTLINDFLDLQRMESGKQNYQPIPYDIKELANEVIEQWQGKNNHNIVLTAPDLPLYVSVDTDRMKQVLHNLISNAVKYSPNSDRVDIRCSVQNRLVRIDVQDYGLGIPEDAKEKLFTKFYRVDNSDRRQIGGTGLGLSIVKEIVEGHGGKLTFESTLGSGSTFTIYLELYSSLELSGKVVIVEDDENLSSMIAVAFEKLNLPTVRLHSAEDAVFSMKESKERPLLCIVDIQLKGVQSGWDFMAELLKHPVCRETPVIVSTVLEQPNHFYETTKERYLKKPFTIERLLELAQALLAESQVAASVVFPFQDQQLLADSLENNGIKVKEFKVNSDFIEVGIDNHGQDEG